MGLCTANLRSFAMGGRLRAGTGGHLHLLRWQVAYAAYAVRRPGSFCANMGSTFYGLRCSKSFCNGSSCHERDGCFPTPCRLRRSPRDCLPLPICPIPVLTVITLFFGLASCLFYLHYRNLVPLAIAHAILGISIGITIPEPSITTCAWASDTSPTWRSRSRRPVLTKP